MIYSSDRKPTLTVDNIVLRVYNVVMGNSKQQLPLIFKNDFYNWETRTPDNPIETQNYSIIQICDNYHLSKFDVADHVQVCDIEISFSMFNSFKHSVNGVETMLNPKELTFIFKNEKHCLHSKNAMRSITIAFDIKPDSPSRKLFENLYRKFKNPANRIIKGAQIQDRITAVVSEMMETKPYREISLDSALTEILIFIARPFNEQALNRNQNIRLNLPEISNYIENNFKTIVSVDEICFRFGYSHAYICKYFKEYYGMTMKNYILKNKMEYAQRLLSQNYTVTQVSDMLCYSSPYNFSKAYKTYFGHSPIQDSKE